MTQPIQLASLEALKITIELVDPGRVKIIWPDVPTEASSAHFPDLAAQLTRLFANSSTELARLRAGRKR